MRIRKLIAAAVTAFALVGVAAAAPAPADAVTRSISVTRANGV